MLVNVTKKHIEEGLREDPHLCPVALALHDVNDNVEAICERHILMYDESGYPTVLIDTPDPVRRRIQYYDRTGKMKPFSFEVGM